MKSIRNTLTIIILVSVLVSCAKYPGASSRPGKWAQPVVVDGVPNLYKVDENLYRSAQPTAEGMKHLKSLNIKTVINLRAFSDDKKAISDTGLSRVDIPMYSWDPQDTSAEQFVTLTADKENGPFLVHCYHGSDRTGSMVSIYRVSQEGWSSEEATQEMLYGGFGFHKIWQHLIHWTRQMHERKKMRILRK